MLGDLSGVMYLSAMCFSTTFPISSQAQSIAGISPSRSTMTYAGDCANGVFYLFFYRLFFVSQSHFYNISDRHLEILIVKTLLKM